MAECKPARDVRVTLYKDGRIKNVHDREMLRFFWEPKGRMKANVPLDGEHFEWDLSEYTRSGVPLGNIYKAYAQMASNDRGVPDNRNTAKIKPLTLIKLDCGLWAAYKIHREYEGKDGGPQRDFGIVENGHVWLAQYVSCLKQGESELGKIKEDAKKALKGAPLALELATIVADTGLGAIRLVKHAMTETGTMDEATRKSLYICFPDLHLCVKWPDLPNKPHLKRDRKEAIQLQGLLRAVQRSPGLIHGNSFGSKAAKKVQEYLEQLYKEGIVQTWAKGKNSRHNLDDSNVDKFVYRTSWWRAQIIFSAKEFLAEKDIVDRALRVHSSWFHGTGEDFAKDRGFFGRSLHKHKLPFGKKDLYDILRSKSGPSRCAGDASAGFDLVNLLFAILKLQEDKPDSDIRVRQVGDLCELWQNQEFLYHGFWARQTDAGGKDTLRSILSCALGLPKQIKALRLTSGTRRDDYQYRYGPGYYDPQAEKQKVIVGQGGELIDERRQLAPFYTFNPIPWRVLQNRYVVGDMIDKDFIDNRLESLEKSFGLPNLELTRRQLLLKARLDSVRDFSLPLPREAAVKLVLLFNKTEENPKFLHEQYEKMLGKLQPTGYGEKKEKEFEPGKEYIRESELGYTEVRWNRLILDLLENVKCKAAYGNHDGYRGDPLLNKKLTKTFDKCDGWISDKGLWFEHGHRWDEYNRDGCAFGSGPTNLGYYWWHNLGGRTPVSGWARKEIEAPISKDQQKCQAGAAVWFLLLHFKEKLPWLTRQDGIDGVNPFDVYAPGPGKKSQEEDRQGPEGRSGRKGEEEKERN
ncbi:MAG: hypothetical protein ACYS3S_07120 [Planctomycetota bacterium]|jgi:hypothetical protein